MLPWRRHRRSRPSLDSHAQADTWQLCSLLLDYPDEQLVARLPLLREVLSGLPASVAEPVGTFLDHVASTVAAEGLGALQVDYVDTFDVTRKCALHLTYYLHGDTRNRGASLVRFKQLYREHGVELADSDSELPDFLPVILEFGATTAPDAAWKLLNDHRVGIELLRLALAGKDSPWLPVVEALRSTLPSLDGDDEVALAKLIAEGPPTEEVGIDNEPYAIDPRLSEHFSTGPQAPGAADVLGPQFISSHIPVGGPR